MHINLWPGTWEPRSIKKPSGAQDSAQAQTKLIFEVLQRHLRSRSQIANLMFVNRQIFRVVSAKSCFLRTLLHFIFKWQIQAASLLWNYLHAHANFKKIFYYLFLIWALKIPGWLLISSYLHTVYLHVWISKLPATLRAQHKKKFLEIWKIKSLLSTRTG